MIRAIALLFLVVWTGCSTAPRPAATPGSITPPSLPASARVLAHSSSDSIVINSVSVQLHASEPSQIEASTNLVTWFDAAAIDPTNPITINQDYPQCFYRAWPLIVLNWSPTTDPMVVGYNIYIGSASRNYTQEIPFGNVTNCTVPVQVIGATNYFSVTAVDNLNNESAFSNEATWTFIPPILTIQILP